MARTRVFVSYSHDDRDWVARFSEHTAVLERRGLVEVWSDRRIGVGEQWEAEIEKALSSAKVAVLMVSPAFLASEFIWHHEMPRIVAHAGQGMDVLPLIVRPCAWRLDEVLARLQARPTDGKPLSLGNEGQIDQELTAFAYELAARIGKSPVAAAQAPTPTRNDTAVVKSNDEWAGYYNKTRPIRLVIRDVSNNSFRAHLEYVREGTITTVEGSIHNQWSADDPLWSQIGGRDSAVASSRSVIQGNWLRSEREQRDQL